MVPTAIRCLSKCFTGMCVQAIITAIPEMSSAA